MKILQYVRRLGLVLVSVAFLAACGGSDLAGDAVFSGSNAFCDKLVGAEQLPSEPTSVQEFKDMADFADELVSELPSDAPQDLRSVLTVSADIARIAADHDGDIADPLELSSDERDRMFEAAAVFERVDIGPTEAWLLDRCPDLAETSSFLASTGLSSGSGSSESAMAASATPTAVPSPTPSPTPTPIPVVSEVLTDDGQDSTYRARTMEVGAITRTNGSVATYFGSDDVATPPDRLFVEMASQATTAGATIEAKNFTLVTDAGRTIAASDLYDPRGDRLSDVVLKAQDFAEFVVAFELPADTSRVDQAVVQYGGQKFTPAAFPVTGSIEPHYPVALDLPIERYVYNQEAKVDDPCSRHATMDFRNAAIDVDGQGRSGLDRSARESRFLLIEIEVENSGPLDGDCYWYPWLSLNDHDWRVRADGRPASFELSGPATASVGPNELSTGLLRFEIPVGATKLELVDETGRVALEWAVDLPSMPGEDGWTRSDDRAPTAQLVGGAAVSGEEATTPDQGVSETAKGSEEQDSAEQDPDNEGPEEQDSADPDSVDAELPGRDEPLSRDELARLRARHLDAAVDGDTSLCFVGETGLTTIVFMGGDLPLEDEMIDDMLGGFDACGIDPIDVAIEAGLRSP